ncbi:type II toxin-antitoxin system Phd/YefM family antitoxin [Roseovarius aestuariivivens]|uniref:type II toxin-antitoxin system Phd/YefM family antitoxin n=1 Tax=Roseovarius aestuariivivens TaxID=1888910 RepID=UPI00108093C4|nr:type II toxin-antitoxin system Phd/YefM family antitoxin [Roseovarius aestuariivivens]
METGTPLCLPTSEARAKLSEIITKVQDPRASVILTRHDKPVAAVVSMEELRRIWSAQEVEAMLANRTPLEWVTAGIRRSGKTTPFAAAEEVRRVQMDRKAERALLAHAGLAPVEGGELGVEVEEVQEVVKRKGWWGWLGNV